MWLLILMSNKWYARDCVDEEGLRDNMKDILTLVNEGTIVAICDDWETFCDETGVQLDDIMPETE